MIKEMNANKLNLTAEHLAHVAEAIGEPAWHIERRLEAFAQYENLPMPSPRLENWRYTDITTLHLEDYAPAAWSEASPSAPAQAPFPPFLTDAPTITVLHWAGAGLEVHLPDALLQKGVKIQDLREALKENPERFQRDLGRLAPLPGDKLSVLHTAAWDSGLYLFIPANVNIEGVIEIIHLFETPGAHFPHTMIVAETSSAAKIVETYISPDDAKILCVGATEVFLAPNASVEHTIVERMGRETIYLTVTEYEHDRDSRARSLAVALGGKLARNDLRHRMLGAGSEARLLGMYYGDGDQHLDFRTEQDHQVGRTGSDLLYKGVLTDQTQAVFSGFIRVHPGAQGTDAYQANRNLLLSDHAKANTIPNLEIGANEVRCTHGATVGPVMPDETFYLKSRGLDPAEAEALIVMGFFEQVLREIKESDLRLSLQQLLASKLKGDAPKYFMDLAKLDNA